MSTEAVPQSTMAALADEMEIEFAEEVGCHEGRA
jgi:hypothetical protein